MSLSREFPENAPWAQCPGLVVVVVVLVLYRLPTPSDAVAAADPAQLAMA